MGIGLAKVLLLSIHSLLNPYDPYARRHPESDEKNTYMPQVPENAAAEPRCVRGAVILRSKSLPSLGRTESAQKSHIAGQCETLS
jgi:hypothetical protein